uniref:Uncharacterized protein n=1 Tax=Setaria viridis TaxID=4556 RepID=A0A4U6SQU9_SETVI|nr:hypothetical protein SEVIR_9G060300v2 [Setaria viridis]
MTKWIAYEESLERPGSSSCPFHPIPKTPRRRRPRAKLLRYPIRIRFSRSRTPARAVETDACRKDLVAGCGGRHRPLGGLLRGHVVTWLAAAPGPNQSALGHRASGASRLPGPLQLDSLDGILERKASDRRAGRPPAARLPSVIGSSRWS